MKNGKQQIQGESNYQIKKNSEHSEKKETYKYLGIL